ncbi:hypothetical protein [Glaciimonas immobilis]|uniref:Uncharacterized protein n=2 Tax=Glaciimonas immobilis TaxID=728004 RepID=A0A840RR33_9BURK|nr:hypothetical protein [Glaciimonas immobilis]KAF3999713.1 hypothetical protein HAV38_00495 [Glaciimonas immobilis]MBB5200163.1 hypothetical protein [Glaciimonas immobilis]
MQLSSSLRTRARRRTVIGIALSVLLHIGLFTFIWFQMDEVVPPAKPDAEPLVVSLLKSKQDTQTRVVSVPKEKPAARHPPAKPVVRPKVPPKVATSPPRRPSRSTPPPPLAPEPSPLQATTPSAIKPAPPGVDMSTMLDAARNRRRAEAEAEGRPDPDPGAPAESNGPADNSVAMANIKFMARKGEGGGGVFQITSKGPRVARYVFRGWGANRLESQRQTIEVDAGLNGDVDLAIIRSMIKLIRKRYPGDFEWDSQRLGRVVTLSAKEDNQQGLENFLMQEFFSTRSR